MPHGWVKHVTWVMLDKEQGREQAALLSESFSDVSRHSAAANSRSAADQLGCVDPTATSSSRFCSSTSRVDTPEGGGSQAAGLSNAGQM